MSMHGQIREVLQNAVRERVFPGSVVGWWRDGHHETVAVGTLTYEPEARAVSEDTVYDLASVTKAIPTSSLMHLLLERGQISLDDQVTRWIPELAMHGRDRILVRHLLTYTMALNAPHGMSRLALENRGDLWKQITSLGLVAPPGERYMYTNGPAMLMGAIAERVLGDSLDNLASKYFFEPLAMSNTWFSPVPRGYVVAPSEREPGGDVAGVVHDESSRVLMESGKISGAAGLFSTAPDLLKFLGMLAFGGSGPHGLRIFQPETVRSMYEEQYKLDHEEVGLGWELNRRITTGEIASAQTFSKTGFTGTLVAVDPVKAAALVHLSNYTYPVRPRSRAAINAVRRAVCDIVFADT